MEKKEIQSLLDGLARTACDVLRASAVAVAVSDRQGKRSVAYHPGTAKPSVGAWLENCLGRSPRAERVSESRSGRHRLACGFRVGHKYQGWLAIEGNDEWTEDRRKSAEQLADLVRLSIEGSLLQTEILRDQLTGLFNSEFLRTMLQQETRIAAGLRKKLALMLLDIDSFSKINQQHGTAIADSVLISTSARLAAMLRTPEHILARRVDVWLEDHLGRMGGDEFAILLFDVDRDAARALAERTLDEFRRTPVQAGEIQVPVTLSIGLAFYPDDATSADKLLIKAYQALYVAKSGGRNQFWMHSVDQEALAPDAASADRETPARIAVNLLLRVLSENSDVEGVLAKLLEEAKRATRADRGRILLLEDGGGPAMQSVAGPYSGSPPLRPENAFTSSLIRVPLQAFGRTLGALEVESASGTFQEADHSLVRALAHHGGPHLERLRRLQMTQARLSEVEEKLRRSLQVTRDLSAFSNIVGTSPAMRRVFDLMEKVAGVDYPLIVEGETGTGKELVVRAIHFAGRRKDRPFFPINCAAISETILESELFGHVKGAFTGADQPKQGLFQLADGGTLFLDEIEEMSQTLQRKLLRALEDRAVRPVGGSHYLPVDVRVIASTNRPVKDLVEKDLLREDLYYRLATFVLRLPPLRERAEDIPLLCDHFLSEISRETGAPRKSLSPEALGILMAYNWPGNVRELRNELRKAHVLSRGQVILPDDLPPHLRPGQRAPSPDEDLSDALRRFERTVILQALERCRGNISRASQALGWARNTLKAKMRQHGIAGTAIRPGETSNG